MKNLTIFFILMTMVAFAQQRDRRAELATDGGIKEISVSPDEKIWLTSISGKMYYTNNISENWHYGDSLENAETGRSYVRQPHLERISFFNKDTAIISGYISADKEGIHQNGYYLTKNAGKSWELLNFGDDTWVYNAYVLPGGYAWMGGSSGAINFSKDYGQHWTKLNSPYNASSRIHTIYMKNNLEGVSGALHNEMYTTTDNWKSFMQIETPEDQHLFDNKGEKGGYRIEKVVCWKDYIVVSQHQGIYYTKADVINWKLFAVNLIDVEVDSESGNLVGVTNDYQMVKFTTPDVYQLLSTEKLPEQPKDLQLVNGALYALLQDNAVVKVTANGIQGGELFTEDHEIAIPELIREGKAVTWGVQNNQIYLTEHTQNDWYREAVLDFPVSDLKLVNDSTAIVWTTVNLNYKYSLVSHKAELYKPKTPLQLFLEFPITDVVINSGSTGCFHSFENEVYYSRVNDSTLATNDFYNDDKSNKGNVHTDFRHQANLQTLNAILVDINSNPEFMPTIADFGITKANKKAYLEWVEEMFKKNNGKQLYQKNKAFFELIPSRLHEIDKTVIAKVLNKPEQIWSTTSHWFSVEITNSNDEVLTFYKDNFVKTTPWYLGWEVEYKELHFNCYSIAFSKFIKDCLPQNFYGAEAFDNSKLLIEIAGYLGGKE